MKRINSEKILNAIVQISSRFPMTMLFILALTGWQLYVDDIFLMLEPTFLVLTLGILLSITAQLAFERFFLDNPKIRWLLQGVVIVIVILYYWYLSRSYLSIDGPWNFYSIPGIRSMILFFVSTILFIWLPSIKTDLKFSDTFLVAFKAYFSTFFFSVILYIGLFLIFGLFEFLFFSLDFNWGQHMATLVFCLFAPIFFVTNIPNYHLPEGEPKPARQMPKFLNYLISYILVPVLGILTVIIVLYIVTNITSDFFEDNILEGLLLTYTINGWILLILAASIDNQLVKWFRKIFPYALIFVVVLQMISTFLQIQEVGVTHGRYFILLFGVGSVISAGWYLVKKQSLKMLPIVAVVAGFIALVPPVDAMTVSVNQQRNRIEAVLHEYDMFDAAGEIVPNEAVLEEDQETVSESLRYLSEISALNQLDWLPEAQYNQMSEYLGFDLQEDSYFVDPTGTDVFINDEETNISVGNFDQLFSLNLDDGSPNYTQNFEMDGETGELVVSLEDEFMVWLAPEGTEEGVEFDFSHALEELEDEQGELSLEELTFNAESGEETAQIVIKNYYQNANYFHIEFYLLF